MTSNSPEDDDAEGAYRLVKLGRSGTPMAAMMLADRLCEQGIVALVREGATFTRYSGLMPHTEVWAQVADEVDAIAAKATFNVVFAAMEAERRADEVADIAAGVAGKRTLRQTMRDYPDPVTRFAYHLCIGVVVLVTGLLVVGLLLSWAQ